MPWKELSKPTGDDEREFDLQYRGKARFLVDESAGIGVAKILQGEGYNVKSVADLGLCGRSDEDVFAPGSDGRDNNGLVGCLAKAVLLADKNATWFQGKKLDFSSDAALTITSQGTRHRYLWKKHGMPMIWED